MCLNRSCDQPNAFFKRAIPYLLNTCSIANAYHSYFDYHHCGVAFKGADKYLQDYWPWSGRNLIIINAISYSIYFILVKPLMLKYNPVQVIRWIFTLGLLMILPFGLTEFMAIKWQNFGTIEYGCISFIIIGGTFLAYLFNAYGIKILRASVAGAYIYIQLVFATFIAMVFLKEKLELYKIFAAVLIFTGVYLSNRKQSSLQSKNN